MRNTYLIVHGHFYQPPREDPFRGHVPREEGAEPFHDFNEKINAECYLPNVLSGNFERISFDLGPTLARWLATHEPATLRGIITAEKRYRSRHGQSNAMAHTYNHTILPLASAREKRIQLAWGLADYRHRFGHLPRGLWLPETAVDLESLAMLATMGIQFTVLAPWQAAEEVDSSEPYSVTLPHGRSMAVFFYNSPLSGGVSFNSQLTINAETFVADLLLSHVGRRRSGSSRPGLLLIATDGELYGHHQPYRELFLQHLLTVDAPRHGFTITTPMRYLAEHPPARFITLRENSSWSCHHGVTRWRNSCACSEGDGSWKWHLRRALNRLAAQVDVIYETEAGSAFADPWVVVEKYLDTSLGRRSLSALLERYARVALHPEVERRLERLLEAQYHRQLMFTSCAFFFEDLDRIEPLHSIASAARAISLVQQAIGVSLESSFLDDLTNVISWRSGRSGVDLYQQVVAREARRTPAVSAGGLAVG